MPFNIFVSPSIKVKDVFFPNTAFAAFFRDIIFGKYLIILSKMLEYKKMCGVGRVKVKKAIFRHIDDFT